MKEKYIAYLRGKDGCDYSPLGCNQKVILIEVDNESEMLAKLFKIVIGTCTYDEKDDEFYWERGYDWEGGYDYDTSCKIPGVKKDLLKSVEVFKVESCMGDFTIELRRMRDEELAVIEEKKKLISAQKQEERDRLEFERLSKKFKS